VTGRATIRDADRLLAHLRAIHAAIRDAIVAACEGSDLDSMATVVGQDAGDTIFAIDRLSETVLLKHFDALAREWPLVLVAEGLGATGRRVMPDGARPEIVVIVDPIDGTRGLMYQKRPAWILTGVAPFAEAGATLSHVELALQTEIPLVKQHLSDSLWATRGSTAVGERLNRLTGERTALHPRPSRATSIAQGFGNLSRFFPGPRGLLAEIDDALVERVLGELPPGRAVAFEDQYICTGGQLYELMMGHDRWCADVRPLVWARRGTRGLCCHPYDLCTEMIARAAGVTITDAAGRAVDAPLDVDADVSWIGYANAAIRGQVEPVLIQLLEERGLAPAARG
jgi:hypothetical protein